MVAPRRRRTDISHATLSYTPHIPEAKLPAASKSISQRLAKSRVSSAKKQRNTLRLCTKSGMLASSRKPLRPWDRSSSTTFSRVHRSPPFTCTPDRMTVTFSRMPKNLSRHDEFLRTYTMKSIISTHTTRQATAGGGAHVLPGRLRSKTTDRGKSALVSA